MCKIAFVIFHIIGWNMVVMNCEMRIYHFQPSAPELNPIEVQWKSFKRAKGIASP